jgi:hypothetical protein
MVSNFPLNLSSQSSTLENLFLTWSSKWSKSEDIFWMVSLFYLIWPMQFLGASGGHLESWGAWDGEWVH